MSSLCDMSNKSRKYTLAVYAGLREMIAKNGLECALKLAKSYGYDSAEMLYIKNECKDILSTADEWRAAIKTSEVGVACISCFVDLLSTKEPYVRDEESVTAVKACIDLAKEIGCPTVHHTLVTRLSGGNSAYPCVFNEVLCIAEEIAEYAEERGIDVIYEPQGMLFNGYLGYSKFFEAIHKNHKNTGICLDVGNPLWVDEPCYPLLEEYAHHVKHVHLKDYVLDSEDTTYRTLSGRTIKEVPLGTGIIDLDRVLNTLDKAHYRGIISIEDNTTADYSSTAENALGIIP